MCRFLQDWKFILSKNGYILAWLFEFYAILVKSRKGDDRLKKERWIVDVTLALRLTLRIKWGPITEKVSMQVLLS